MDNLWIIVDNLWIMVDNLWIIVENGGKWWILLSFQSDARPLATLDHAGPIEQLDRPAASPDGEGWSHINKIYNDNIYIYNDNIYI